MRLVLTNWRGHRYLPPKMCLPIAGVALLTVASVFCFEGVRNGSSNFDLRLLFAARSRLQQNPAWHPKLKVFAYDDLAVSLLQKSEPPAGILAETLVAIAARKPQAVLIDKMFSYRLEGDSEKLKSAIAAIPFVYTSASFSHTPIPHREPIARGVLDQQASHWEIAKAAWIPKAPFAYGANPTYASIFTKVGHLNLAKAERIYPLVQVGNAALPHWALRWWENARVNHKGISSAWGQVPVNHDGTTLINIAPLEFYSKKVRSIASVFSK
ncbi:MAG: hypothetical protein KDD51_06135, partial [Bdellovibrionales bacterium]|nr:hypothetical protein [Bdellovibrionales bacterium]